MKTLLDRLSAYPIYQISDSSSPFVWTEMFLRAINRQPDRAFLHIWPLEDTVILGMLDKQVPHLEAGLSVLEARGYEALVRTIGGLAVVADEGVLNLSLFLPNPAENRLDIKAAYQLMTDLVQEVLADQGVVVEAGEIPDSYCPGSFDLSIAGQKFAGLAQRRIKDGIVVSIYLSVYGDQERRGRLIRDFYEAAIRGEKTTFTYPEVNPKSMANLSDLCGQTFALPDLLERFRVVLAGFSQGLFDYELTAADRADLLDLEAKAGAGGR